VGGDSARRGKSFLKRKFFERTCGERKAHVFSGHGGEAGDYEKKLESPSTHLGNLFSDRSEFVSFTGTKTKRSRPFSGNRASRGSFNETQPFEKTERSAEAGDETGEAKGA